jgi:hypothetical protein
MVTGCRAGAKYPIHIHVGKTCADSMGHWDTPRGDSITDVTCAGNVGTDTYISSNSDPKLAWTVGDGSATDIVGKTIVIHDPDTAVKIACGQIVKQ